MIGLTPLETAVLQEHCNQLAPEEAAALRAQLGNVRVLDRKNTGTGFFTYFATQKDAAPPMNADPRHRYDYFITAKIDDVENALGFMLWTRDGYIDFLEGYAMALPTTADMDLAALRFELRSPPPA